MLKDSVHEIFRNNCHFLSYTCYSFQIINFYLTTNIFYLWQPTLNNGHKTINLLTFKVWINLLNLADIIKNRPKIIFLRVIIFYNILSVYILKIFSLSLSLNIIRVKRTKWVKVRRGHFVKSRETSVILLINIDGFNTHFLSIRDPARVICDRCNPRE